MNTTLTAFALIIAALLVARPAVADNPTDQRAVDAAAKAVAAAAKTPPQAQEWTVVLVSASRNDKTDPNVVASLAPYLRQMQMAQQLRDIAKQKLAAVATAANPAAAQVLLREAESQISLARSMERRVMTDLRPTVARDSGASAPLPLQPGCQGDGAMCQALHVAFSGGRAEGAAAFYESAVPDTDPTSYNAESESLTVPSVGPIDVQYLDAAFQSQRGSQLFASVPNPNGSGSAVQLTPAAAAVIQGAQTADGQPKVGGVAMAVTLDLLRFLEVPDFRKPGPAVSVDQPVLVSLKQVVNGAQRYVRNWAALPDDIRYPGDMNRVVGFVLAPSGDIVLVGVRSEPGQPRIDLDSLIVAIQAVWRDGSVPEVSLDPIPQEMAGPQVARIIGVPSTSAFARTMLDADYAMKRIMIGTLKPQVPGYFSQLDLITGSLHVQGAQFDRFWLTPIPLGNGDVQISGTGRTVLVNSGISVLTQSQTVTTSGLIDSAANVDPIAQQAAEQFTNSLSAFEQDPTIDPPGIFNKLRGLVDLVTICKLWREFGMSAPILSDLSRLPVNVLPVGQAAPNYYPGVTATATRGSLTVSISGGMLARVRAAQGSLFRQRDVTMSVLEHAADTFGPSNVAQLVDVYFSLPEAGAGGLGQAGQLAAGMAALDDGNFARARDIFLAASQSDPFDADTWARLSQAQFQVGETDAANTSIRQALKLEPINSDFQTIAIELQASTNPDSTFSGYSPTVLRDLSLNYSDRARAERSVDRRSQAIADINFALRLWPDNADAYAERAKLMSIPANAMRWSKEAIARYRGPFAAAEGAYATQGLAHQLSQDALFRAQAIADWISNGDYTASSLEILDSAIKEVQEARALMPDDLFPYLVEPQLRAQHYTISAANGSPDTDNLNVALAEANEGVRRAPDVAFTHFSKAVVLWVAQRDNEALTELSVALQRDPAFALAYEVRSELYAATGDCAAAKSDAKKASSLGSPPPTQALRGCA